MKQELFNKLSEIKHLADKDGPIMVIAERYLNDYNLENFASKLSTVTSLVQDLEDLFTNNASKMSEEDVEELAALATALDESGDEVLMKQASVLDEILISIGSDPKAQKAFKQAEEQEINRLKAKYNNKDMKIVAKEGDYQEKARKAIDENVKTYKPMEASLSTRYSPDMPGVSMVRISEGVYQCPVTKKIFDFRAGYTTVNGNKVPGTDVSNQTQGFDFGGQHMNFSTREDALNK